MAQLPSGRHIAIQATPLFALIEAVCLPNAIITRLLEIEMVADLRPYIDVMFFHDSVETSTQEIAPGGKPLPSGIEPYVSGYTLATIGPVSTEWPVDDQDAFAEYLASEPVQGFLVALLNKVSQAKHRLGREGDAIQRMQALMWETGCHPLQDENDDDPTDSLIPVSESNRAEAV